MKPVIGRFFAGSWARLLVAALLVALEDVELEVPDGLELVAGVALAAGEVEVLLDECGVCECDDP